MIVVPVTKKTTEIVRRLSASLLALVGGLAAAQGEGERGRGTGYGVAELTLSAAGSDLAVEFVGPAASLVGFEHAPATAAERATLRLATDNLKTGDGMLRLNTQARCRLASAEVQTGLDRKGRKGDGRVEMSASYRFTCEQPDRLESAAVGLFVGFPALERVLVRYALPDGKGAAELTRNRPVVSFIPLQ